MNNPTGTELFLKSFKEKRSNTGGLTQDPNAAEGIAQRVNKVVEALKDVPGFVAAGSFGSRWLGFGIDESDYDVEVLFDSSAPGFNEETLKNAASKVGSIYLNEAKPGEIEMAMWVDLADVKRVEDCLDPRFLVCAQYLAHENLVGSRVQEYRDIVVEKVRRLSDAQWEEFVEKVTDRIGLIESMNKWGWQDRYEKRFGRSAKSNVIPNVNVAAQLRAALWTGPVREIFRSKRSSEEVANT